MNDVHPDSKISCSATVMAPDNNSRFLTLKTKPLKKGAGYFLPFVGTRGPLLTGMLYRASVQKFACMHDSVPIACRIVVSVQTRVVTQD
jgi:hypothetical protein